MFLREKAMKNDTPEQERQPSAIEILKRKNTEMIPEEIASQLAIASKRPWQAAGDELAEFYRQRALKGRHRTTNLPPGPHLRQQRRRALPGGNAHGHRRTAAEPHNFLDGGWAFCPAQEWPILEERERVASSDHNLQVGGDEP